MKNLKVKNANKIIFIENKANYRDYIQNKINKGEFVVYHGGMYGEVKGQFFKKLYEATKESEFYHWSDIDIGGFKIFARLKKIIPNLKTYMMDTEAFYRKRQYWKEMSKEYREKLARLKEQEEYSYFYDVIDEMLKNNSKLEQEAFI